MKNIIIHADSFFFAGLFLFSLILGIAPLTKAQDMLNKAAFAGGCFWCMEKPFEKMDGVISVTSGYTGGSSKNPTYGDYAKGGHVEAIEIVYDPKKISYEALLEVFWRQVDPTDSDGQFVDRGKSYSTAIFYFDKEQKDLAKASKQSLEEKGLYEKPIVTPIIHASTFYSAEDYHQDYYKKDPIRYKLYRNGSGRDRFLENIWGKKDKHLKVPVGELKKRLTPLQYHVTQEEGTERAFDNEYWDYNKEGIYVDIVSGEPLFSSLDKYKSGTGWPSFTKPLVQENIVERKDTKLLVVRTEVRSKNAESHLGHLFNDGPKPSGMRYCLNSAALRFIPVKDLTKEGYEDFLKLFK